MGAKECDLETVFVLLKFKEYVFKPPSADGFGGQNKTNFNKGETRKISTLIITNLTISLPKVMKISEVRFILNKKSKNFS